MRIEDYLRLYGHKLSADEYYRLALGQERDGDEVTPKVPLSQKASAVAKNVIKETAVVKPQPSSQPEGPGNQTPHQFAPLNIPANPPAQQPPGE